MSMVVLFLHAALLRIDKIVTIDTPAHLVKTVRNRTYLEALIGHWLHCLHAVKVEIMVHADFAHVH